MDQESHRREGLKKLRLKLVYWDQKGDFCRAFEQDYIVKPVAGRWFQIPLCRPSGLYDRDAFPAMLAGEWLEEESLQVKTLSQPAHNDQAPPELFENCPDCGRTRISCRCDEIGIRMKRRFANLLHAASRALAVMTNGFIAPENKSEEFVRGWNAACEEFRLAACGGPIGYSIEGAIKGELSGQPPAWRSQRASSAEDVE